MALIRNRPLFTLVALLALGAWLLPFLNHAPNRLVSGQPVSLWLIAPHILALGIISGCILAAAGFKSPHGSVPAVVAGASALMIGVLIFAAGAEASRLAHDAPPAARTSLGSGFWVMLVTSALILADALARAGQPSRVRLFLVAAAVLPAVLMVALGHLDDLSVMKEYANKAGVFWQAVLRHGVIVLGALLPTLVLGLPLGVLAFRRPAFGQHLLAALSVVQTIPSMALFGLLMAPLAALSQWMPALGAAGISGIGLSPAIIALTLYSLLPIVRNTREGLSAAPRPVVDAARGMGLTERQILWQVRLPLAAPVFLSGLRITLVQAIGLAAVAALIGAGGLGSIMFQGLFANAIDLVLLGAIPIVAMAIIVDALFRVAATSLKGART